MLKSRSVVFNPDCSPESHEELKEKKKKKPHCQGHTLTSEISLRGAGGGSGMLTAPPGIPGAAKAENHCPNG